MPTFEPTIAGFRRHLAAENKSPKTIRVYTAAARKLAEYVPAEVTSFAQVEKTDVQDFIAWVLEERTPGYANNLFRSLQQFFKWFSAEEDRPNPMQGLKPPLIPEQPVQVLRENQLKALLKACSGKDYVSRRDNAVIRLMMDSGLRRAELTGLKLTDIDVDECSVWVLGKGRRPRQIVFGTKTARALDQYLRARAKLPHAHLEWLWLSAKHHCHLTDSGIAQMLRRRGGAIGMPGLHPHQLRHTWAHFFRADGGHPDDLQRLAGWRSPSMVQRYGASLADERARDAGRRHALGDRF